MCGGDSGHGLADFECPPLAMKKWGISGQDECHDIVCLGASVPTAFDNLLKKQKDTGSIHSFVACGFRPMVTGYTTRGCENRSFFSATALASTVATKLSSAMLSVVTSFWGGDNSGDPRSQSRQQSAVVQTDGDSDQSEAAKEPAIELPLEHSLEDPRRRIRELRPSPTGSHIAMTDEFGRVLLLDSATATIARVWKGYRDAQCGWVVATESVHDSAGSCRRCSFLVIFAPKRELLEVWAPMLGVRVSAFNVGPNCKLLSSPDCRHPALQPTTELSADCYIITGTGETLQVVVPFEATLSSSLSSTIQDRHHVRRLRTLLTAVATPARGDSNMNLATLEGESEASIIDAIGALRAPASLEEAALVCLAARLPTSTLRSVQTALEDQLESILASPEAESMDVEQARAVITQRRQLMTAYDALQAACPDILCHGSSATFGAGLDMHFGLTVGRLGAELTQRYTGIFRACFLAAGRVSDANESAGVAAAAEVQAVRPELGAFLHVLHSLRQAPYGDDGPHNSSPALPDGEIIRTAGFLFQPMLAAVCDVDRLLAAWQAAGLTRHELLRLLLRLCFSMPLWHLLRPPVMENLQAIFGAISTISDPCASEGLTALLESQCNECPAVGHALHVAIVFNSICPAADTDCVKELIGGLADLVCLRLVGGDPIFIDGADSSSAGPTQLAATGALRCLQHLRSSGRVYFELTDRLLACGLNSMHLKQNRGGTLQSEDYISAEGFVRRPDLSLRLLSLQFPIACSPTMLAMLCTAELARRWETDRCRHGQLVAALDFAAAADSTAAEQTVLLGLWAHALKRPFLNLASLLEKVGKPPKERLLLKDLDKGGIEMNSPSTNSFALAVWRLLKRLVEVCATPVTVPIEPMAVADCRWSEHFGRGSEFRLAAGPSINDDSWTAKLDLNRTLIVRHELLSRVIALTMRYSIRIRPLELFPTKERELFFAPFVGVQDGIDESNVSERACTPDTSTVVHDDPVVATEVAAQAQVQSNRRQFLSRALCAAVEAVYTSFTSSVESEQCSPAAVFELADALGLEGDDGLSRQHVRNLAEVGCDAEAEEALLRVSDNYLVASALLEVVGYRLALLMDHRVSPNALDVISKVPGTVYEWCVAVQAAEPLPGQARCRRVPLEHVSGLLAITLPLAEPESAVLKRLEQLASAVGTMVETATL